MNKKQKRNLLLLLAAVLLCGGLYLGLHWYNDRPQSPVEETAALAGEMGEIVSLRYSNVEGELNFQKKDGVWRWEGDADYPLDTNKVESTAQVIASLTPLRTLDVQQMDSLEAYGLAEPSCTAQITDENGKTFSLSLGGSVSSSYYLQRQGDSTVYVVGSTLCSHLEETIEDLLLLDSIPRLTEHNLRSLCISGRVTVNLTPTATEQTDDSGNETTVVTWDCQGTDVTENQRIKDLLSQLKSLSFTGNLDYSGSSDATQPDISFIYRSIESTSEVILVTSCGSTIHSSAPTTDLTALTSSHGSAASSAATRSRCSASCLRWLFLPVRRELMVWPMTIIGVIAAKSR